MELPKPSRLMNCSMDISFLDNCPNTIHQVHVEISFKGQLDYFNMNTDGLLHKISF